MSEKKELILSEALEDYLFDIYKILKHQPAVRVRDIAKRRNVRLSSVVNALKQLSKLGLVNYEKNSFVTLTDKGLSFGKRMEERRELIIKFLVDVLGVPPDIANMDVHKMEHFLSTETLEGISRFVKDMEKQKYNKT